jgi:two-component system, chemotaxis family, response regulator Rcp1
MNPDASIDLLLVEDNPGDARLAMEAFKDSKVFSNVYHVHDGVEAVAFLRQVGTYAGAPRPHLILLDLNLPRKDGKEVLSEIKGDTDLKRIPVVVLSISDDETDIDKISKLQANGFFTKPIDFDQFLEVVRCIEDFWLSTAKPIEPDTL